MICPFFFIFVTNPNPYPMLEVLKMLSITEITLIVINLLIIVISVWDILPRPSTDTGAKIGMFLLVVLLPLIGWIVYWLVFRKKLSQQ